MNWKMHQTYKENELSLMRTVVQAGRKKTMSILLGGAEPHADDDGKRPQPSPCLDGLLRKIGKSVMEQTLDKQENERKRGDTEALSESQELDPDGMSSSSTDGEDTAVQSEADQLGDFDRRLGGSDGETLGGSESTPDSQATTIPTSPSPPYTAEPRLEPPFIPEHDHGGSPSDPLAIAATLTQGYRPSPRSRMSVRC